ncbi:S8 family peptidase [Mucilaginibacter sp. FT3.2]|uniref:S8 family peptidase n=1 Tax=Mucilaginibacter sp. FT3.2 TaxID=2723090 RepID=UPI0016182689|nr:S8 family peptidase [Mucilaginibacter sp. FT3.2]MBB6233041.1 hypothetical protein [Mucilaginibacter sp. FT3.2]
MADFPHLRLTRKLFGAYNFPSGGNNKKGDETIANLANRSSHGNALKSQINNLRDSWVQHLEERKRNGLPDIFSKDIKPIYLQVDLDSFTLESLRHWGIEILSEEDNGFIIGVSVDDFNSLADKIEQFLNNTGTYKNTAAKLWQINDGVIWRLEHILTPELSQKWDQIIDDEEYNVYAGIACYSFVKDYPEKKTLSDEAYQVKIAAWEAERNNTLEARDEESFNRQDEFDRLIDLYSGEKISGYIDFNDSFYVSFRIVGKGLKDIALSYQYLYELGEINSYKLPTATSDTYIEINPDLIPPEATDPKICIIDSGIQERHRLLEGAIDFGSSTSFIAHDSDVNDKVVGGGHGTKVAGAVLYYNSIPRTGQHTLPFWIQNARVLDEHNKLPVGTDPAKLMIDVTNRFAESRIFNLSIAEERAFSGTHMPAWAATIDKISVEQDKLFIVSTGNISLSSSIAGHPGLREILASGPPYPDFLYDILANSISSPGISAFSLAVGSVCIGEFDNPDKKSFGHRDEPSSFTRTGLGLWDMIKPDVVEYGGDFVYEKLGNQLISNEESISPELVCSTRGGHSAVSKHSVGTSFATPKVTHIAGWLNKNFPQLTTSSYKALIVQSARLPENKWRNPSLTDLKCMGYGIPSLERATQNTANRITFLSEGEVNPKSADVFMVKVPTAINRPGLDNEILIEITLDFKTPVRRTRKYTKSYLASWLSWEISTPDEGYNEFCDRVIKSIDNPLINGGGRGAMQWTIFNRGNNGIVRDVKRQDSTTQKDWAIISSNKLPEEFSLAVVGHHGWEKDIKKKIPYSIVISFEALDTTIPIYELFEIENRVTVEQEVTIQS